jgi:hypothetical protein
MRNFGELSDQLNNWSDTNDKSTAKSTPPQSGSYSATTLSGAGVSSGFPDRALQKVRQAWVQVRGGSWPWSEILSFCEYSWAAPGNDLRTPRVFETGGVLLEQSCGCAGDSGRNLRNQSQAAQDPREVLGVRFGLYIVESPGVPRSIGYRSFSSQHDSGFSCCKPACRGDK